MVKNLPAKQEMQVQSQGQEDPLEREMVFHSNILAWEIPWTEEPGRLQSMGVTMNWSQPTKHQKQMVVLRINYNYAYKFLV